MKNRNITIWDWHGDECARIKFYIGGEGYIGENLPDYERLTVSEGYWMESIPANLREEIIMFPCVKTTQNIRDLGYKYAFAKDKAQQLEWGEDKSIILPPIFNDFNEPKVIKNDIITMVMDFQRRDLVNYELCKSYGIKNYGSPDNYTDNDNAVLNSSRYLFHAKEIGYLCNVVIKAINVGTPIIFTSKSYEFGYKDYIKYPLIADTKEQLDSILNCSQTYNDYVDYLKDVKQDIIKMQNKAKLDVVEFLNKIW